MSSSSRWFRGSSKSAAKRGAVALFASVLWGTSCAANPPKPLQPPAENEPSGGTGSEDLDAVDFDIRPDSVWNPSISPLIYGFNEARTDAGQTVARDGGNRFTAFNWENGASNAGKDYMYQNDGYLAASDAPGAAVKPLLDAMAAVNGSAVLTVPIVDWVSADKDGGGDVRTSGSDYLEKRFMHNHPSRNDGKPVLLPPDVSDRDVYQDEFATWVKTTYPNVPVVYDLDNEPDLWSETHAEIHPEKVGYEELVRRNTDYAKAIKSALPMAEVAGFVSYGWNGFVTLQGAPDRGAYGDFINFYLDRMQTAGKAAGRRLIDYLDLHWYPEATGGGSRIVWGSEDNGNAALVEARVQAPRSLWDFSYKETSWIAQSTGPLTLIPRMKDKIAKHYPGTKLAFTEWNYGGSDHISGAVATADVLGIFAREGVALSTIWPSGRETFNAAAMRAYRNYDGAGAHFGDQYVWAKTSSVFSSSVHAAVDSAHKDRLVVIAINKRPAMTTASLHIKSSTVAYKGVSVFVLQGTKATLVPSAPVTATADNEIVYAMPPLSVSVLVPYTGTPPPVPQGPGGTTDGGADARGDAGGGDASSGGSGTSDGSAGGQGGAAGGAAGAAGGAAGSVSGAAGAAGGAAGSVSGAAGAAGEAGGAAGAPGA